MFVRRFFLFFLAIAAFNGIASATDVGSNPGNGNVTISFGTVAIKSFTLTYGSGSGTVADPTYQLRHSAKFRK